MWKKRRSHRLEISAPRDFEHRLHTSFDPHGQKFVGLPQQWQGLLAETPKRPRPLVDPSRVTPVELTPLKPIVRGSKSSVNGHITELLADLQKVSVSRSNSLRRSAACCPRGPPCPLRRIEEDSTQEMQKKLPGPARRWSRIFSRGHHGKGRGGEGGSSAVRPSCGRPDASKPAQNLSVPSLEYERQRAHSMHRFSPPRAQDASLPSNGVPAETAPSHSDRRLRPGRRNSLGWRPISCFFGQSSPKGTRGHGTGTLLKHSIAGHPLNSHLSTGASPDTSARVTTAKQTQLNSSEYRTSLLFPPCLGSAERTYSGLRPVAMDLSLYKRPRTVHSILAVLWLVVYQQ
ncbi:serine/threonine-protein kinase PAK 6-like [Stegostoma tigrinum]|uniref:serine/threonine-protein kinase PAK 6-like n=1 Tax=Stegostoma tigrinum TaxID=3053191 RepID=UPI002870B2C2|nr:serine/threonine-protein kinase PAK 6-like [Stegostoma tigrinum]